MRFSANLGFLWTDRPLPAAIRAAHTAGFDAVECHWPYDTPASEVTAALRDTGLPMLGLNTRRGAPGENGLSALPGRSADARAAVDEALAYARQTDTAKIHVMAGFATGPEAEAAFLDTLRYACDKAADRTILIEPLNHYDAPGYFLTTTTQAQRIIEQVASPNLRLMFDCYHVQLTEGDVTHCLERLLPIIGHVQVASVPDRAAPDHGELSYPHIWATLDRLGYTAPIGAEYKPGGDTDATLGWLKTVPS
jgi:hydroxypyruvate isomerase